jgi:hypothetical protein
MTFVYILKGRNKREGWHKIGMSDDPKKRAETLRARLMWAVKIPRGAGFVEQMAHWELRARGFEGDHEWFQASYMKCRNAVKAAAQRFEEGGKYACHKRTWEIREYLFCKPRKPTQDEIDYLRERTPKREWSKYGVTDKQLARWE